MDKFDKTVFVRTDGVAKEYKYPPPFKFAAVSYHWQRLQAKDKWNLPTGRYEANIGAFYQDHFKQLLEWVKKVMGKEGIHHVWIDAICIDQQNESAKALQVPEITWLFNRAECVIAAPWLAHRVGTIGTVQMYDEYVQRCWVIAEISSAKSVYYTNWDGRNMNYSRNDPKKEGFCPPGADPNTMKDDEKKMHLSMSNRVVMLRGERTFGQFHVDEVVKIALELKATKEKDKLYALMPTADMRIRRKTVQMDLQECVGDLMHELKGPVNRLRLAMGVSRFRGYAAAKSGSWSFGAGSDYLEPWARSEYLKNPLDASVTLNDDDSLTFSGRYHKCQMSQGAKTTNSDYHATRYTPVPEGCPNTVFYHPKLDPGLHKVFLCRFGLDQRRRVVGVIVEEVSQLKIGLFFMQMGDAKSEHWTGGTVDIK